MDRERPALRSGFGTAFPDLPRAHGEPLGVGRLRAEPADFQVEERLGFAPDGEGEHLLLWVRKTDANTDWVARRLAELADLPHGEIGFAGLKDRRAVTSQWFSLPRPRTGLPDWSALAGEGIEVLESHAHRRKLRRGTLAGNRFRILIRELDVAEPELSARLTAVARCGVPNYFGEQRFGRGGANLGRADALFRGTIRRPSRHQHGLMLSAARSQIFNEVAAQRVARGDWCNPVPGDCLNLAGSQSFFLAEVIDESLVARCAGLDLHPTGPLWGRGEPPTASGVRELEESVAARFAGWREGLARFDLRQERRALRVPVGAFAWVQESEGLRLSFELPAGSYATAVLRELIDWGSVAEEDQS